MSTTPWYKQFWPWFLIILPGCVVVASIVTVYIAVKNEDDLVSQDYYKRGKAINLDRSKYDLAKSLNLSFQLSKSDNQLLITQASGESIKAALHVHFYHPTMAEKDIDLMVNPNALGQYHIDVDLSNKWTITLSAFDGSWLIKSNLDANDSYPKVIR